jgi:hypothetical protein
VIDVNSRSIGAGKMAELRNELRDICNREIRSRATRVALLQVFAKFTASMTIFNLFTAITPALIGQGHLSSASAGVRAADIFIKNGVFATIMLTTIRLISLAILDDLRHCQYFNTRILDFQFPNSSGPIPGLFPIHAYDCGLPLRC